VILESTYSSSFLSWYSAKKARKLYDNEPPQSQGSKVANLDDAISILQSGGFQERMAIIEDPLRGQPGKRQCPPARNFDVSARVEGPSKMRGQKVWRE